MMDMEKVDSGKVAQGGAFAVVPDELVVEIFTYVPKIDLVKNVAKVCRRFARLTNDMDIWREARLFGNLEEDQDMVQVVRGLEQHFGDRLAHVRSLEVGNCTGFDAILDVFTAVGPPRLESLYLCNIEMHSQDSLKRLVDQLGGQLKQVRIQFASFPEGSLHFMELLSRCSNLQKLCLSNNEGESALNTVRCSWSSLMEVLCDGADAELSLLAASAGNTLKNLQIGHLDEPESYLLMSQFRQLEVLCINCSSPADACLLDGISSLGHLRDIALGRAFYLSASSISSFLSMPSVSRRLERLSLAGADLLDDSCLELISHFSSLTELILISCDQISLDGLMRLVKKMVRLQYICIDFCDQFDSQGLFNELSSARPDLFVDVPEPEGNYMDEESLREDVSMSNLHINLNDIYRL